MADEGSTAMMAELIREEKELRAKLAVLEQRLEEPEKRLARARELLIKAKEAYEQLLDEVKPLRSDKVLIEGELELIEEKKRDVRMEARRIEVGGIRPGTQAFVEQMNELAGDPSERALRKATHEAHVEAELAALKETMGDDGGGGDA